MIRKIVKNNLIVPQAVAQLNDNVFLQQPVAKLKKGDFKSEYAGKINFYCNVIDDKLKHETDNQTIGLILCQNKKKILAEYSLRGIDKPVGILEYKLTRVLPKKWKSVLPTIKEIEKELSMKR